MDFTKRCLRRAAPTPLVFTKTTGLDVTIKAEWSLASQWYSIVDGGTVDLFMIYGIDAVNTIATVTAIFKKEPCV
ncbi:hypothetical protein [Nostoc sp. 'Lobaria pulmonaria (5183) cyanobiont']|uniref:hypothetical protein n=1 Tax=Nostoc sp. 'Lobaria pulmonaria (5183) cyanobiont' TaxID=1618022 RepID=UPI000CF325B3|nr:hypothetical protein [Nostoc sp. 'Lobaria pulmonaria (5183) cyanobiont']